MCFGSAFIASNSSASYKVRKVYLTQHPEQQITIEINPVDFKNQVSQDDATTTDEEDKITYSKSVLLYKKSDYLGQKKTISLTYDTDMKIDVYGENEAAGFREHLATFIVNGIDDVANNTIAKKDNSTKPKVSLSFELSRSSLIQLNKAEAKIEETYVVEEKPKKKTKKETKETKSETSEESSTEEKKDGEDSKEESQTEEKEESTEQPIQKIMTRPHTFPLVNIGKEFKGLKNLSKDQLKQARERMRWFEKRDEDKIKTDKAKNDFESVIYAMRDWINEDENNPYIPQGESETLLNKLSQEEDWLLEGDGD